MRPSGSTPTGAIAMSIPTEGIWILTGAGTCSTGASSLDWRGTSTAAVGGGGRHRRGSDGFSGGCSTTSKEKRHGGEG